MRSFSVLLVLAYLGLTSARVKQLHNRQSDPTADIPVVPAYNFVMPIDHFSSDDAGTYNNRYYVNDTYYQPGGPVIVYGSGESSFTPLDAAGVLAELGGMVTAPMELARQLKGLVIGWEHRYYGKSLPFELNEIGIPLKGLEAFNYLTIEQEMEDLVYFANSFNTTTLPNNNVVPSTANLDPYHTPWIYIGGSYSGALSAFLRIRNPEIFYASWSSSGPVQASYDGAQYYNSLYRTLPSNCSTDLTQIMASFNQIVSSGSQSDAAGYLDIAWTANNYSNLFGNEKWTAGLAGIDLGTAFAAQFQYFGPINTTHWFCDMLESFDGVAYQNSISANNAGLGNLFNDPIQNPFNRVPSDDGIIAAYGENGLEVAQAAYFYAMDAYSKYWLENAQPSAVIHQTHRNLQTPQSSDNLTTYFGETSTVGDEVSWIWQTRSTFGYFQCYNATTNKGMEVTPAAGNADQARLSQIYNGFSSSFPLSDFPSTPDTSLALKYGGWDMTPSNVMFTNGDTDPWRSFGVMSPETQIGAPQRTIVQTVPKCNEAPDGNDLFGLLYKDKEHCSDIQSYVGDGPSTPTMQGANLFVEAYKSWVPCFNQSRDAVRNGENPDGSAKANAAERYGLNGLGLWSTLGVAFVLYYLL